ncbi:hypothetical protein PFISCL1PPCAC_21871, partial [Pristionchus fissidentatus]
FQSMAEKAPGNLPVKNEEEELDCLSSVLGNSMVRKLHNMSLTDERKFPILELPAEISLMILSYMNKYDVAEFLHSLPLDKMYAEWKEKNIRRMVIRTYDDKTINTSSRYAYRDISSPLRRICDRFREVYSKCEFDYLEIYLHKNCDEYLFRELIEHCKKMRCKDLLSLDSYHTLMYSNIFTDESLRELMSNKRIVEIEMLCEGVTAAGLLSVWEYLLDGKLDSFFIHVSKPVVADIFDMLRTDGEKTSWKKLNFDPIEARGRTKTTEKYEMWCGKMFGDRPLVHMSRIYDGKRWTSEDWDVDWDFYANCPSD